jgi:uncharacterized repeat protein (TIGR01451 family)
VLGLGDLQYGSGALADFNAYYDPTWGRVKQITSPAPGNHDPFSSGYSAYFGARAPGRYYSYDLGAWHLISLDSNSVDAAQISWLRSDLAAYGGRRCVLAYWHHPRFSSGTTHGNSTSVTPFWTELYNAKAELVLSSHEHNYERFGPQDPNGVPDPVSGIREFVVGTGGRSHYGFGAPQPNSEVRNSDTYGVLKLTLRPGAYDWQFLPEDDAVFTDSGTGSCHSAADLALTKADAPDPVLRGERITYTLNVTNNGPSSASHLTVTDLLPAGMRVRSARVAHGRCTRKWPKVTCNIAELSSGETTAVTIVGRATKTGVVINSASVAAGEPVDLNPGNDQATAVTQVLP